VEEQQVAELQKVGEGRHVWRHTTNLLEVVGETLDGVPDEGVVGDRSTVVGQGVGDRFLLKAVVVDALVALLDVPELLLEVARARLLVVAEEGGDA
jgi:hypothetical protein